MPKSIQCLGEITIGSGGASNATFSSIPQTFTDLRILASGRVTDGGEGTEPPISRGEIVFNGSGGTYSVCMLYGITGGGVNSAGGQTSARGFYQGSYTSSNATSNTFSSTEIYIPNYTASTAKSYIIDNAIENNGSWAANDIGGTVWSGTAAITSIKLNPYNGGNFAQHSTFTLYGISKT
jgi:hypothetical protein